MGSFNESNDTVAYKSSLELKALQYCDLNPKVEKFSLEPFAINYIKLTDNKVHRYYPDMLVKFSTKTFVVEIKSSQETIPPKMPKSQTTKSIRNYQKAMQTYAINQAKWKAAIKFCESRDLTFMILTEKHLDF